MGDMADYTIGNIAESDWDEDEELEEKDIDSLYNQFESEVVIKINGRTDFEARTEAFLKDLNSIMKIYNVHISAVNPEIEDGFDEEEDRWSITPH